MQARVVVAVYKLGELGQYEHEVRHFVKLGFAAVVVVAVLVVVVVSVVFHGAWTSFACSPSTALVYSSSLQRVYTISHIIFSFLLCFCLRGHD